MIIESALLKRIIRKLQYYRLKPVRYFRGRKFLNKIMNEKKSEELYLILSSLIGDSLYGLSCINALKEKNKGIRIVVVCAGKWEKFIRTFDEIDEIRFVTGNDYEDINSFLLSPSLVHKGIKNNIININPYYFPGSKRMYDLIGEIHGLPENYSITYHKIKSTVITSIENFDLIKDRIIVMNPYSVSAPYYTEKLWNALAKEAMNRGFIVYTNVINDQTPIKETESLTCDIYELFSIACSIKAFVSQRSGILDFLIPSGVDMFVSYENLTERFYKAYTLKGWNSNTRLIEETDFSNTSKIIDDFITFLSEKETE